MPMFRRTFETEQYGVSNWVAWYHLDRQIFPFRIHEKPTIAWILRLVNPGHLIIAIKAKHQNRFHEELEFKESSFSNHGQKVKFFDYSAKDFRQFTEKNCFRWSKLLQYYSKEVFWSD
ncbi:hypothetical protein LOAG_12580 [Loa loa]|uniref:Uncharacterized protein n=1 Tax=Loa loa TaxID=7209 RepID=A0A1S0TKZ2_LOALO|nr:hypothetical protein LOAG_12580 [Loa loa]EFO15928.1 hypothetical protein LOAG_12580 [Loa loa]